MSKNRKGSSIDRAIKRSSFGTRAARKLRSRTPPSVAQQIAADSAGRAGASEKPSRDSG